MVAAAKGAEGPRNAPEVALGGHVRLAGDGSTAFTGSRPKRPRSGRLSPAQKLPAYVVFSWGGAGEGVLGVGEPSWGGVRGGGGGVWGWVGPDSPLGRDEHDGKRARSQGVSGPVTAPVAWSWVTGWIADRGPGGSRA